MKYCLQEHDNNLFAGSKAKLDVTAILEKEGYKSLYLSNSWPSNNEIPFLNSLGGYYIQKKLLFCIRSGCEIVIQWPFYEYQEVDYIIKLIGRKNVMSILLVHDFNNLRNFSDSKESDIKMCRAVSKVVVHTEAMKQYLLENEIDEDKIAILTSFDYLTEESTPIRNYSNKVVFAGNLKKSSFLKRWDATEHKCQIICYGTGENNEFSTIEYRGRFSPENISAIEGSWGLVWDGDSIDECNGDYGNYLKYNSPHKFSLYSVAGLPLIVWSQSALASYVKTKNIGVVVNSLKEIDEIIRQTSVETYRIYRNNIIHEAEALKSGNHIKAIL